MQSHHQISILWKRNEEGAKVEPMEAVQEKQGCVAVVKRKVPLQSKDTSEIPEVDREVKQAEETNCTFMVILSS